MPNSRCVGSVQIMIQWVSALADLPVVLLTPILGAVMMLDSIPVVGILVPADVALLVATAGRSPAASAAAALGVILGCLAGWSLSFLVGWHFGERLRRGPLGEWIGSERWMAAERTLDAGGIKILMAAPFLPVLNTLVPIAAGGLRISYRRFLPSIAIGSVLWTGLYTAVGLLGGALAQVLDDGPLTTLMTAAVGLGLGWIAIRSARRHVRLAPAIESRNT